MRIAQFIIMSFTLTLTGNDSHLSGTYFPEINLNDGFYECGLVDFQCYNSIPNVNEKNNLFHYINNGQLNIIEIPTGTYEIIDIFNLLQRSLNDDNVDFNFNINKNTLRCQIKCSTMVCFDGDRSIRSLLGFNKCNLGATVWHESHNVININDLNIVRVECIIISGAYLKNNNCHTIHEFSPRVSPGYKIIEVPKNIIYLPVVEQAISYLKISLLDQNSDPIDFRGETITIRLHIRRKM